MGSGRFDFVTDLGAIMPMKVISMLLGIPEDDQEYIRDRGNAQLRTEAGKPMSAAEHGLSVGEQFEAYIDWRADNPSDDIMTELLNVEFVDETGTTRRLTRDEILRVPQRRGRSRQRNDNSADRLGGQGSRRAPRPAPRARRKSRR